MKIVCPCNRFLQQFSFSLIKNYSSSWLPDEQFPQAHNRAIKAGEKKAK